MKPHDRETLILATALLAAFIVALCCHGCGGVQRGFDDVCDVVARADHYNAMVFTAVQADPDASASTKSASESLSEAVIEAHEMCFEEPQ